MPPIQAWPATATQVPGQVPAHYPGDVVLDIRGGEPAGLELPRTVPTTCSTLAAAFKSGTGKFAGQAVSSGIGELVGTGMQIGFDLLDATPGAQVPSLVIKGALVVAGGGLAGYKAGQLVQEGFGKSGGARAASAVMTLLPVAVPLGVALGTGIAGGSLAAASTVLTKTVARMAGSVTRDLLNEVGRGVMGDTQAVDAEGKPLTKPETAGRRGAIGALAPLVPNFGVAASGELALRQEAGPIAGPALVKGGYAFMLEGGSAAAALADGGGLAHVPGGGLPALTRNLRDLKGTATRAWEHTSARIALGAVSGDLASGTGAGPYVTSALLSVGELRKGIVDQAHAQRDRAPRGEREEGHPAAGEEPQLLALPSYPERDDSRGSEESLSDGPALLGSTGVPGEVQLSPGEPAPVFGAPVVQEEEPPPA